MTKKEIKERLMKEYELCIRITNEWWEKFLKELYEGDGTEESENSRNACKRLAQESREGAFHTVWVMKEVFKVIKEEENDELIDRVITTTCKY